LQPEEQIDEQDAAITAEMSQRLEPLWAALSATITQIEANLPAHVDTSSEAPSAAASILPPGAAQVHHSALYVVSASVTARFEGCCVTAAHTHKVTGPFTCVSHLQLSLPV